jgi:hypothetical protein
MESLKRAEPKNFKEPLPNNIASGFEIKGRYQKECLF